MTEEERWQCFWLATIPGIGAVRIKRLLEACGSPKEVFNIEEKMLEKLPGFGSAVRGAFWKARKEAEESRQAYHRMGERGIQFITIYDETYPMRLQSLPDPPFALYVQGDLPREEVPTAAIVGARRCSHYGREAAGYFGRELAKAGIQIISGMALGVDGAGQWGALEGGGRSFGVLGCGVDVCYPREHMELYLRLKMQGGLISEFPPGFRPLASNFPMRNRVISGLADVLLVIEARERSGSLITVDFALEQGKEIFALPGRLDDTLSQGCNRLIKNGANLLMSPEDITDFLGFFGQKILRFDKIENLGLEKEEKMVYSCLDLHPKHLEAIVVETGLGASCCMAALVHLETLGVAAKIAGNYYAKKL